MTKGETNKKRPPERSPEDETPQEIERQEKAFLRKLAELVRKQQGKKKEAIGKINS